MNPTILLISSRNVVPKVYITKTRLQEGVFRKEEDTFWGQVLDY
jgi:hypothetical protein